jgi:hypothetical protein
MIRLWVEGAVMVELPRHALATQSIHLIPQSQSVQTPDTTTNAKKSAKSRSVKLLDSDIRQIRLKSGDYVEVTGSKHLGCRGWIQTGGNGYFSVKLDQEPVILVTKRSIDLQLVQPQKPAPTCTISELDIKESDIKEPTGQPSTSVVYPKHTRKRKSTSSSREDEIFCQTKPTLTCSSSSSVLSCVGKTVKIIHGKHMGHTGKVIRSGHGFYAIHITGFGQVMKRVLYLFFFCLVHDSCVFFLFSRFDFVWIPRRRMIFHLKQHNLIENQKHLHHRKRNTYMLPCL